MSVEQKERNDDYLEVDDAIPGRIMYVYHLYHQMH